MGALTSEEMEVIAFTQGKRKTIAELLTATGYPVNDGEMMRALLSTLKDMDKANLDVAKIRLAEGDKESERAQIEMVANLLRGMGGHEMAVDPSTVEDRAIPELPSNEVIVAEILPEELELPRPMGSAEAEHDATGEDD